LSDFGKDRMLALVRKAMARAMGCSVFYLNFLRCIDIDSITSYEALASVPFTTPDDVSGDSASFLCVPQKDVARVTALCTSGSTAKPKKIFFTDGDLESTICFFGAKIIPILGSSKRVLIMMSDARENSIAYLLSEGVERNSGIIAEIYGHVNDPYEAASTIKNGDCIVGVPSEIMCLCRRYPSLRPASVLLSADYVPHAVISTIRKLWQCRVYTHYGMTETCFGCAVQSEEDGLLHIRKDRILIEIIDPDTGKQLRVGKEGEVVITTFGSEAMPLFRYKTGDISSLIKGRYGEPLGLGRIRGRLKNRITVEDGTISIEQLDELVYSRSNISSYRVGLDSHCNKLILFLNIDELKDTQMFLSLLKTQLPASLHVVLEQEHYPIMAGKRRICLF